MHRASSPSLHYAPSLAHTYTHIHTHPKNSQHAQIDIAAESARLARVQSDLDAAASHAGMRSARRSLPAFAKRDEVLALLRAHDVLVVSGATGCGKSTQVWWVGTRRGCVMGQW